MDLLLDPQNWVALATLAALEIVLGIDNVIFISILASRLPPERRDRARKIGLAAAMLSRLALLFSLAWVIGLTQPLFTALGQEVSGRDLVLLLGGLFLMAKSTHEIHGTLEGEGAPADRPAPRPPSFAGVIVQIMLLDVVFSLDSVITAVGMVEEVAIMAAAVVLATVVMVSFSGPVGRFVGRHPTVKMLALSFLILIGVALVAEGLGLHIPKGYIYFAMAFSVGVEMLNLSLFRRRARATPGAHARS